jgi:peptidoglycan/LPS O-acetylase OafA/YrhL
MTFSRWAIGDYVLCLLVVMNFVGIRRVAHRLNPVHLAVERPVRMVAAYTFTLYLLHQPLFLFWGAIVKGDPSGIGNWALVTALTAASVVVIGHFAENRRHLLTGGVNAALVNLSDALSRRRNAQA